MFKRELSTNERTLVMQYSFAGILPETDGRSALEKKKKSALF
jgi:hypothetical protein